MQVRLKFLTLVTLIASGALAQAQNARQGTSSEPLATCEPSDIEVHLNISKLPYQMIKNRPGGPAHGIGDRILGGRAVQPFGISVEWGIEGVPMNDGKNFCGRINSVTFTAGDTPPQIWISPELQDDCQREVALEHERQHVGFFYDYLDDITAALPRAVESFNRSNAFLGPASGLRNTLETAVNDIRNKIERANTNAVDRLLRRNESIDTPEAYDQLSSICR